MQFVLIELQRVIDTHYKHSTSAKNKLQLSTHSDRWRQRASGFLFVVCRQFKNMLWLLKARFKLTLRVSWKKMIGIRCNHNFIDFIFTIFFSSSELTSQHLALSFERRLTTWYAKYHKRSLFRNWSFVSGRSNFCCMKIGYQVKHWKWNCVG